MDKKRERTVLLLWALDAHCSCFSISKLEDDAVCVACKYIVMDENNYSRYFFTVKLVSTNPALQFRVIRRTWWPATSHFDPEPGCVFKPMVSRSRVSLLETDYNMHKSNSTFFLDLDVSRTELLAALRAEAIRGGICGEYTKGVTIILADVSCSFKKEMKPCAAFEMYSRVLAWDKKWLYVVTHFVQTDSKARLYTFQPWVASGKGERGSDRPVVYATGISKCVIKCGRLTVPPEKFLRAARLLAPDIGLESEAKAEEAESTSDAIAESEMPIQTGRWSWKSVEKERMRALEWAEDLAVAHDMAHKEFGKLI